MYVKTRQFGMLARHFSSKFDRLDWKYLCDPSNRLKILENIARRKGVGDIDAVCSKKSEFDASGAQRKEEIREELLALALRIPNRSHPALREGDNTPKIVKTVGTRKNYGFEPARFEALAKKWNLTRTDTSLFSGPRSYYLLDQLADLEAALVNYSVAVLKSKGFQLISVPDLLPREIIEDCGMDTQGPRSQVYALEGNPSHDVCLSGTAEMGISYYLKDKAIPATDLPLKIVAVSRCFRAETSKTSEERGIYRVHQFTKVEMYGVYQPHDSENGLAEFTQIQEEIYGNLGLELRVLDMPECELGAQAYRKFDVEAYMPGKRMWGEVSSASDCTDYQSRRLNLTTDEGSFPHTINGTACAVPRIIIALTETHQSRDGTVEVPACLVPYLGYDKIAKSRIPKVVSCKPKEQDWRSSREERDKITA